MKTIIASLLLAGGLLSTRAATTIDPANKYAYGANIGWMDSRGDTNNGAVIGEYVCSGYIYSANVGWINLGGGSPANGIQYQNNSAADFGVNQDGFGNLRGFAYGANIGWVNFESNGAPKVDMTNGKMSGSVYSANCGWISLSNAFALVQTDTIAPGADLNHDGIADAWEIQNFGTTSVNVNADPDHDGASNLEEYIAGTNPNDGSDSLRITFVSRSIALGSTTLKWTAKPTRAYTIQSRPKVDIFSSWVDSVGYGLGVSNSTFSTGTTNSFEFYRIRAYRPLGP